MPLNLEAEIARLERATTAELKAEFQQLFGYPSWTHNRRFLVRRIAWKLQEREYGGLSERARRRALEIAETVPIRIRPPRGDAWIRQAAETPSDPVSPRRDPRLPAPGTVLTKEYRGETVRLAVLADGFQWRGHTYKTLSAVTKAITGSHWNGYLWWGLAKRKGRAR